MNNCWLSLNLYWIIPSLIALISIITTFIILIIQAKWQKKQFSIQLFVERLRVFNGMKELLSDLKNESNYDSTENYRRMLYKYYESTNGITFLLGNEIFQLGEELVNIGIQLHELFPQQKYYWSKSTIQDLEERKKAMEIIDDYNNLNRTLDEWISTRKIEKVYNKYLDAKKYKIQ